jgi:hypothetical protein
MYKVLVLLACFSIPQLIHANSVGSGEEICSVIKNNHRVSNVCDIAAKRTPLYFKTEITQICSEYLNQLENNPKDADKFCSKAINKVVNGKDFLSAMMSPGAIPMTQISETISSEMKDCNENYEFKECTDPFIGGIGHVPIQLLRTFIGAESSVMVKNADYSDEACLCLKDSIKDPSQYSKIINDNKEKTERLMHKAAGKKIINEFAANLEDMNFFKANYSPKTNAAGTSMLGPLDKMAQFECNDQEAYAKKIRQACGETKISSELINTRITDLLSSYGEIKGAVTLREKFTQIQEDILNLEVNTTKKTRNNSSKTFSRSAYDKFRFGSYKTLSETRFINEITESILDDKDLGPGILAEIQNGKSPSWAIFSVLKDKSNPNIGKIVKKAARNKSGSFYKGLSKALESKNPNDYSEFIDNTIDFALDMHPGLKAIYKDTNLFLNARSISQKSRKDSLLDALEANPNLLSAHFGQRCSKIMDQFAEAICVRPGEILQLANRSDLSKILESEEGFSMDPKSKDLMLCNINQNLNKESVFKNTFFNSWDRLKLSNYYERKTSGDKADDRYSRLAHALSSGNGHITEAFKETSGISDAFLFGNQDITSIASSIINPDANSNLKSSELQNIMTGVTSLTDTSADNDNKHTQTINPVYSAPLQPQAPSVTESASNGKAQIDPREILREFLASEQNKAEVDKHLSNIKSEDQAELLRLKEELATNKEAMLKLMSDLDQNKMKKLTEEFEELESKYKTKERPVIEEEVVTQPTAPKETTSFSPHNGGGSGHIDTPRETISMANTGGAQTSSAGSGNTSPNSGRTVATESVAQLQKSAGPSESNFSFRETSNGEILVISSKVHESGSLKTEDYSEEVMAFVKKTQPDVKTLKKLMTSGLILKFNVKKNGVQTQQEIKVDSTKLTADAMRYLQDEITQKEYKEAQRAYSFSTLKLLLGIKAKNSVN